MSLIGIHRFAMNELLGFNVVKLKLRLSVDERLAEQLIIYFVGLDLTLEVVKT